MKGLSLSEEKYNFSFLNFKWNKGIVNKGILFANILLSVTTSLLKRLLALLTDVQIGDLASAIKRFGRLALKTATLNDLFRTRKNQSPVLHFEF
ncbi:MAG: hypothetical protein JNL11_10875 [Bdellovibrionaceae bacterium]|nr:hypothetical protein [Pseudobdellovibrionaceae bacterium]